MYVFLRLAPAVGFSSLGTGCIFHTNGTGFCSGFTTVLKRKEKIKNTTNCKPRTSSVMTFPFRHAAMFSATHWYSPESLLCRRLITRSFLSVRRRRLPRPSISGSPFLNQVMFGGGDPRGDLHWRVTDLLGDVTCFNWTFPKLRRRTANSQHNLLFNLLFFYFLFSWKKTTSRIT